VQLIQQPDLSDIEVSIKDKKFKGYYKISRHYNWALNVVFSYEYDFVIIVEGEIRIASSSFKELLYSSCMIFSDDLDVAPDFYEYFLGTFPLLRADKTLWCVSAWNGNKLITWVN
jgi:alpha-1,3-mannosyl-glycoprotein beta-1,2-N-acetylglucosaminyltransferase